MEDEPQEAQEVPKPQRKRRKRSLFSRAMGALFSLMFIAAIGAGIGVTWFQSAVKAPGPNQSEVIVDVPRGLGVRGISNILAQQNVIDDPLIFFLQVRVRNAARALKAGEYAFPPAVTVDQAIDILQSGRAVQYELTVAEGLTSQQIMALVNEHPVLVGTLDVVPPEGTLLPETYAFPRGFKRQALLQQMKTSMQDLLLDRWEGRADDLPISTPLEAVILASIVEKETGVADERPLVASVFHNRLRKGMRLQSDPTVIYGIVGGAANLGRLLTRADLKQDTPFNTYVIPALPPTPIANPGRAAIEAVLNPETSDYFYFVADGTGGHAFAQTLQQHNRNVAAWRKIRDKK